ncbi:MAG: type II secretion system protein [Epsilonproteobacteria bacterium]|nr:type II secretion system protein [Campylobacterota bacterium]
MNVIKTKYTKAFTLLEVLISIGLLGIVIVALFSTVTMMKDSNSQLLGYLEKAKKITKATKVLYLDIISSDGNITIKKDEFSQLCMEETKNSLYALPLAKVCWLVLKKDNTLVRVEGNNYHLPTKLEEKVEVNPVMKHVELFDVYHKKDKVLVFLKQVGKEAITFMIQGITKPVPKKKVKKKKPKKKPTKGRVQTPGKPTSGKGGQPPTLKAGEIPPK